MKTFSVTMLCFIASIFMAQSQESRKVVNVEPQLSDIFNVLELMDVKLLRFDLTSFLNEKYAMKVYIDEYENNKKIKRNHAFVLGDNIRSLNDVPEEYRDEFRKMKQVPEGKNEWNHIKEMSVYIRNLNDSTSAVTINVPGAMRMGTPVKLRPIGDFKRNFYQVRPFVFKEAGKDDTIEIPLVLYGSGWLDGQMIRFCGENEIDPEMKAEILTNIPHHYIIGLELEKAK